MALRLHNTLTRSKEVFTPIEAGKVRLYTCGPTVYAPAHIGNLRTYMFEDILRRYLEWSGYEVTHVMNITDVDDKTIEKAIAEDRDLLEMTESITQRFERDLATLNILPAHHLPRATDYIDGMIGGIQTLLDRGVAYTAGDGSVFFDISKDAGYGQLVNIDPASLRQGERTSDDDYGKDQARDFALWKGAKPADGPYKWSAPWGEGRPGWHMECSIMSSHFLGQHFDIHCGGVDNIFPHHENELAQSRHMFDTPFVNFWLHSEHLIVDGEKMSKSLGNFYVLQELLDRGLTPEALRYTLLATHYRQQLNFTLDKVRESQKAINRLKELARRLEQVPVGHEGQTILPPDDQWRAAMDSDLNISGGLGAIFGWAKELFAALDREALSAPSTGDALAALRSYDKVLGVIFTSSAHANKERIEELIKQRDKARSDRDWSRADSLREELAAMGVILEDTPEGTLWKRG
ncbi:MAG: cysteine--tRNA ligase [Candidatus Marinimicrobia bacterium]|nr:cysteine--tRNA ligase [Candidatus Neomarinimicrobiota bacterium]